MARVRVFELLERQERSQAWLARKLGIDRSMITRYKTEGFPESVLPEVARALDLDLAALFFEDDIPEGVEQQPGSMEVK